MPLQASTEASVPLIGEELKEEVEALTAQGVSKREIARRCGYTTTLEDGTVRIRMATFNAAFLSALQVFNEHETASRSRTPAYNLKATPGKGVMLGRAYVEQLNVQEGDRFIVKVDPDNDLITLKLSADPDLDVD